MDLRLSTPFINSTVNLIKAMTGIAVAAGATVSKKQTEFTSYGVASVITFAGQVKGRFVIDLEPELARAIIKSLIGEAEPELRDRLRLSCIAELNNIIAGDANTLLNNEYHLGLRLAPPIVCAGTNVVLATSQLESVAVDCQTAYGKIKLNIAFQGGLNL